MSEPEPVVEEAPVNQVVYVFAIIAMLTVVLILVVAISSEPSPDHAHTLFSATDEHCRTSQGLFSWLVPVWIGTAGFSLVFSLLDSARAHPLAGSIRRKAVAAIFAATTLSTTFYYGASVEESERTIFDRYDCHHGKIRTISNSSDIRF